MDLVFIIPHDVLKRAYYRYKKTDTKNIIATGQIESDFSDEPVINITTQKAAQASDIPLMCGCMSGSMIYLWLMIGE